MNIHTFTVRPSLPPRLAPLLLIARNLLWAWSHEAVALFQRMDLDLWESCYHNPLRLLGEVSQERLEDLQRDESFLNHMDRVTMELEDYLRGKTWFAKNHPDEKDFLVCYFSAEFGLHESLPIYSGGLGILAGDYMKSASDLGLPVIGIGLLYRQGFFRQYLNAEGWQQETYPENDFATFPIQRIRNDDGSPQYFALEFPGREVWVQTWKIEAGRVKLFMLDTNVPQNSPEDREITSQLYGGDDEMRVKQEIVLGMGGMRALLRILGIRPSIYHMNEGHSAFLALERIRYFMTEHNLNFAEATEVVTASNVFTTHTPVPAGNDTFSPQLIDTYFRDYYPLLGLNREQFLGLGRQNPFDRNEPFCMTVLALRLSAHRNGVSELHGAVSRKMWRQIWPGLKDDEIPIQHVTNGIHPASWLSGETAQLFDRYLGPRWRDSPQEQKIWDRVARIPDAELWRTHERRRERLVAFARDRLRQQLGNRGALRSEVERAREVLDPEALTLGFARRFATYKRATLILADIERLSGLLNSKERPVQIVFSGKAHPRDQLGKELIKRIIQLARREDLRNRIVFIEDYDVNVARHLVQGVDVWINNPRRPLEASGTSGMKAAVNGVLNLSVLDGWWVEGFGGANGWAIGGGEEYSDLAYQDEVEGRALMDILEKEVIPLFYERGSNGLPRGWTAMMKNSMRSICPVFNTNRMDIDYLTKFYLPGAHMRAAFMSDGFASARALADWKNSIRRRWVQAEIAAVETDPALELKVGEKLPIRVKVRLTEIAPTEVRVEVYHGRLDSKGEMKTGQSLALTLAKEEGDGYYWFAGDLPLETAGRYGYGVRLLPHHPMMLQRFEPGLIIWG